MLSASRYPFHPHPVAADLVTHYSIRCSLSHCLDLLLHLCSRKSCVRVLAQFFSWGKFTSRGLWDELQHPSLNWPLDHADSHYPLLLLRDMVKDREAWHAAVHRVTESQTWLSDWTAATTHYIQPWLVLLLYYAGIIQTLPLRGSGPWSLSPS